MGIAACPYCGEGLHAGECDPIKEKSRRRSASPHYLIEELSLEEQKLVDIAFCVLNIAGRRSINLGRAVLAKMANNSTQPHGKQF